MRILGNNTQKQSFLTDHLGSTIKQLDASQNTLVNYSYEVYGKTTNGNGSIDNSYQYTGRENDAVAGLMHYRNRYYSSDLHRFVSIDPIGFEAGPNLYAYVDGEPTLYLDQEGLSKGGKRNLGTEGFTKQSNPKEIEKKMAEAKQNNQMERYKALKGLLKVIKRGGKMSSPLMPYFAEMCEQIQKCSEDPCCCDGFSPACLNKNLTDPS